ncbi:PTS system trehalose-specific IIC component [Aequitasia blattaphilus]|uniref:PTS system trehalose-specific EIIBC component n=1 Tax=Aequitasia blattaphilus TaxID=2949332 RepID=A0ABT1E573_9FIRM|nr:PTS system trehalose-specific EIIBC component [Aequitasia blattaphilus]MCP1100980.1 PTS system trehalose-specific EIIBC component [Aequitasia blattaphilus]MCR8613620.1 PTS system trehalose-specific EIIBC component [Aequitasia blattaphilus]
MGKYIESSKELLEAIGGKENIDAVSHCVTRLRFVLNNPKKADISRIEEIKEVKGTFTQSGQFQVIIGNSVADFYNDFVAVAGVEGVSKERVKSAAKQNQNLIQRMMSALAEIFAPLIPAIIVGGLILGFRNCIDSLYLLENGTKTLVEVSQFWAGIDSFLWLIGEAVFHMLPVGICWSVTKKMGTTQILGIILGLTLVSGQLLNAYGVAGATEIPFWDFGFFKIDMIGYQAQVIPAILAAFTLVYLEKFFRKITPQMVSMIVVPFFSLLLSVIIAHFALGPIGWKIGSAISSVVYMGITGSAKAIFGGIFGFVYAPFVITGLHHMTNAIDMQLIADYQGTMLWPMIALSNIAQGSAVLGMIILQRKNAKAQEVNVPACISCYLGVTEPAMFGVNLKYGFPFVCGMIGSAIAGVISVVTGTAANAIGVGGIPGILSIQPVHMLTFGMAMIVAILVPLSLTLILGKKKGVGEEKEEELKAFLDGTVIPLKDVKDGVFSEGVLGEGLAIIPENNILYAPAGGVATLLMEETKHAIGLLLDNGAEILLHVGIDTINLKGEGFEYLVEEGARIKSGTPLIRFDLDKIKEKGYSTATVCVLTGGKAFEKPEFITGKKGKAKSTTIIRLK